MTRRKQRDQNKNYAHDCVAVSPVRGKPDYVRKDVGAARLLEVRAADGGGGE